LLNYTVVETLRFEEFCEKLSCLFEDDIKAKDLKTLFRKISNNPDAKIDWCEVCKLTGSVTVSILLLLRIHQTMMPLQIVK